MNIALVYWAVTVLYVLGAVYVGRQFFGNVRMDYMESRLSEKHLNGRRQYTLKDAQRSWKGSSDYVDAQFGGALVGAFWLPIIICYYGVRPVWNLLCRALGRSAPFRLPKGENELRAEREEREDALKRMERDLGLGD